MPPLSPPAPQSPALRRQPIRGRSVAANARSARLAGLLGLAAVVLLAAACTTTTDIDHTLAEPHLPNAASPYEPMRPGLRNTAHAQQLTQQAAELIADDPDRAEAMLRDALAADLYHGPAHNNLGVIYLKRGLLYEAANEFEWARKLLPGHPDPRVNLAMTLEKAGQTNEALDAYASALAVWNNYLPALQGKARLQVTANRTDETTRATLEQIVLRGPPSWQTWAHAQLTKPRP